MQKIPWALSMGCAVIVGLAQAAVAGTVTFEWTEGLNSTHVSRHNVIGPVLADDFIPAVSGPVESVEWWGSAPLSVGDVDQWEITFHPDVAGLPGDPLSQQTPMVSSDGDPDGDGVFHYVTQWNPQDVTLVAGASYWFSVANFNNGWTWANPGPMAPTVGSQSLAAVLSVGGNPMHTGPHFGPWTSLPNQNFAFRINVVPEPGSAALFGLGVVGLSMLRRRRRGSRT